MLPFAARDLDLHGQLANAMLGGVELAHGRIVAAFAQPEIERSQGALAPLLSRDISTPSSRESASTDSPRNRRSTTSCLRLADPRFPPGATSFFFPSDIKFPFFRTTTIYPKIVSKKPGSGQPRRQSAVVSHGLPQIHFITCRPSAQHLPTQGLEIFLRDASLVNRPPLSMGRPSGLPLPQVLPQHGRHVRRAGGGGESPIKTHFRLKTPAHRFPVLLADHQVAAHIKQYVADTAFFAFLPEPATVDFPVA